MKLTIDNLDGKGAVDYSQAVVATAQFLIKRQLNEPSLCSFTLAPAAAALTTPVRFGRVVVADDSGNVLFTGYIGMEPALELLGQNSAGAAFQVFVSAVSDELLLDQQVLPALLTGIAPTANQMLQGLNTGIDANGFSFSLAATSGSIGDFRPNSAHSWSTNAGALASMSRSAYRVVDGVIVLTPIGTVTHTLNEADGTLNLSALQASMVKALANDVTLCGPSEPCAYVTEYFQGDGTTVLFDLTREPYLPSAGKTKPLLDLFQGPGINPAVWNVVGSGTFITLTSTGVTCLGGNGIDGQTTVEMVDGVELGGALVFEAGGVQFGATTVGILNGIYDGAIQAGNCVAGFQITQPSSGTQISALINGAVAGAPFTVTAGHMYTLRLRVYCNEMQRLLQTYYSVDNSGPQTYGGLYLDASGSVVLEVQDTTNEVASAPVVLYSGSIAQLTPVAPVALINSANLDCSVASFEISQQGPVWVTSTPPGGSAIVRRVGTAAQGADCRLERTGKLRFYPTSIPQAGELIAVCYRTTRRAVARLANQASITQESNGGQLPGTAAWIGTVTSPIPRSSVDCENAASALLDLATNRGAAWKGKYTAWNMETQGQETPSDVWPGDLLAIASTSANLNANLVVRTVELELQCGSPGLVKYVVSFANDWADALAIKTTNTVSTEVWLPQQPESGSPLANLSALTTSITSSAIAVSAAATAPTGGGFEVRRRDWCFGPNTDSDLVLRSQVNNFTIPREAAVEQYFIRMYDGSTPPNYSRFSAAVFANVAM